MLKAGLAWLVALFFLLLAANTTHAQTPATLGLLTLKTYEDICKSELKEYALTHNCKPTFQRQTQSNASIKQTNVEEFSIAHEPEVAVYTRSNEAPTPTLTKIVSELKIAEPTPTVVVSEIDVKTTETNRADNNSDVIFDMINAHRASIGKVAFIKDEALCSLAKSRSALIGGELSKGILHSGLYNMGLSYRVTENAKIGGDENETVRWWLNSYVHRSAIQGDYTHACGGCTGNHCVILFTSYNPKGNQIASTNSGGVKEK